MIAVWLVFSALVLEIAAHNDVEFGMKMLEKLILNDKLPAEEVKAIVGRC